MINKKPHKQTEKPKPTNQPFRSYQCSSTAKAIFFSLTKEKMMFKLEKRLFYRGKICFFWMVLNDAGKTLRTDSSNHNPFFSLQISSSQISSSYRKKIALPLQEPNLFHAKTDDLNGFFTCLIQFTFFKFSEIHTLPIYIIPTSARLIRLTGVLKSSFSDSEIYSNRIGITTSIVIASAHPRCLLYERKESDLQRKNAAAPWDGGMRELLLSSFTAFGQRSGRILF